MQMTDMKKLVRENTQMGFLQVRQRAKLVSDVGDLRQNRLNML